MKGAHSGPARLEALGPPEVTAVGRSRLGEAPPPVEGQGAPLGEDEELSGQRPASASTELVDALFEAWLEEREQRFRWPATFSAGDVVASRYEVVRLLARGGMGEVYEACDRQQGRRVALKTVLSTRADNLHALCQLRHEARLAQRVAHVNVCGVFDVGTDDRNPQDVTPFFSLELLEGETLRARLERRALTAREARSVIEQLALALAATHQAGVLHRDVKACNVMLCGRDEQLRAVLIDFGLALRMRDLLGVATSKGCGSIGYMAPEQLTGRLLTPRTDIFSFGVVLFEVLSGELPSERRSAARGRDHSATLDLDKLRDVPSGLRRLVQQCTRPNPMERPANMAEILQALRAS